MPVRGRSQPIKLWSLTSPAVQKQDWESEVAKPESHVDSDSAPPVDAESVTT
jgi:hypothetical protein